MKEIKTKPIQASVESYIVKLDIQKQEDAKILIQMFSEVSQEKPVMWGPSIIGFGQRLYKYESGREISYFYAGFSMRKKAISIYLMQMPNEEQLSMLGKHQHGVGCLYIKTLKDVELTELKKIVEAAVKMAKEK